MRRPCLPARRFRVRVARLRRRISQDELAQVADLAGDRWLDRAGRACGDRADVPEAGEGIRGDAVGPAGGARRASDLKTTRTGVDDPTPVLVRTLLPVAADHLP